MGVQIYRDGRHYDAMFADKTEDIPFFLSRAADFGAGGVLELFCGTGRISVPLARQGYAVCGVDSSDTMLATARAKASRGGVKVDWVQADVRNFSLQRTFSLVILAANSLCHLLTLADFETCMARVRAHLGSGGRLILDVFVPDMALLTGDPEVRSPMAQYEDPDGKGKVIVTQSQRYRADTQINHITTYHQLPDQPLATGKLEMRMYFPQELDALLAYNGFVVERKLGDYTGTPFSQNSHSQIIICRKRRQPLSDMAVSGMEG